MQLLPLLLESRGRRPPTAPPPPVPTAVGAATAPPPLVEPPATFVLSAVVVTPAPPVGVCVGSLDMEGFVAMGPFFLGSMDDEDDDETQ